jgi:hypothetical protein
MANMVTTFVKVINLDKGSYSRYLELFPTFENNSTVEVLGNLNKMYDKNFGHDSLPTKDWMEKNVGTKLLEIDENSYVDKGEFSDKMELILNSAWDVPTEYLKRLVYILGDDVVLYGTYEDESYNPIGAFVFAKDYEDMEDLYDDLDGEQMFDDEEYRDEIYQELNSYRDELYERYLRIKQENK